MLNNGMFLEKLLCQCINTAQHERYVQEIYFAPADRKQQEYDKEN